MDRTPASLRHLLLIAAAALTLAACGGADDSSRRAPAPDADERAVPANTDAAGRAQQVPAHLRIDVGGAETLRPFVLAAKAATEQRFPDQTVTVDDSHYGSSTWGLCLGSSEVAAVEDRAGWGIETCEKSGIRILSLELADGAWLTVGNRAAMRPEVAFYVERTLDEAPRAAREAGLAPVSAAALDAARGTWRQFVRTEQAAGTEPIVG